MSPSFSGFGPWYPSFISLFRGLKSMNRWDRVVANTVVDGATLIFVQSGGTWAMMHER